MTEVDESMRCVRTYIFCNVNFGDTFYAAEVSQTRNAKGVSNLEYVLLFSKTRYLVKKK
jgi:hypothetical protein